MSALLGKVNLRDSVQDHNSIRCLSKTEILEHVARAEVDPFDSAMSQSIGGAGFVAS